MSLGQTIFPASGEDIDVLARTVYGEARGEPLAGMIAVAWTVRHRAQIAAAYVKAEGKPHPHYGDGTIASACKARAQYSCWSQMDANYMKLIGAKLDDPAFQRCQMVALGVVHGTLEDRLPGTTHYLNPEIVSHAPAWINGAVKVSTVGQQDFYSGVAA